MGADREENNPWWPLSVEWMPDRELDDDCRRVIWEATAVEESRDDGVPVHLRVPAPSDSGVCQLSIQGSNGEREGARSRSGQVETDDGQKRRRT